MRIQRYLISLLVAATLATAQPDAEAALGAARHLEEAQGNYPAAIEAYKKFLSQFGKNRPLAAKALIRMAEAYQKMGDTEAGRIYAQVVREYADQKEAVALARARLGANTKSRNSGIVTRQVWTGPKVDPEGTVSPDGRYLSFVDWETGDLAVHDLTSGKDRRLTRGASGEFAEESAIAPDGKQVAYAWFNKQDRFELRLTGLAESDTAKPRVLYSSPDVLWIGPYAWSPDGKWIAVQLHKTDLTRQIGLVDAGNGSLRVLKSVDWRGSTTLRFSPDGKYLAFDLRIGEDSDQRDVFVLAIDGSREIPAVVNAAMDTVTGWSPDGSKLLFASDRTGSTSIWELPFRDGKPQGIPKLIKSDVGRHYSLGLTRSGVLYFDVRVGGPDVYTASLDFISGKILSPAAPATEEFIHSHREPDWSPDGKHLAYVTSGDFGKRPNSLSIQSMETGKIRELRPRLNYFQWPRWGPDGASFVVHGQDLKGRPGIYTIDAHTGDVDPIVVSLLGEGPLPNPQWARDGKKIFYIRLLPGQQGLQRASVLIERELASGKEREILRGGWIVYQSVSVSPDGNYVACLTTDPATRQTLLMSVPVSGGEPRELLRLPVSSRFTVWTPDSRSILFTKDNSANGDAGSEVWMIPATGGQARKIDFGLTGLRGMRIQPGGNQVAFFKPGTNTDEVWVMENFLPTASLRK